MQRKNRKYAVLAILLSGTICAAGCGGEQADPAETSSQSSADSADPPSVCYLSAFQYDGTVYYGLDQDMHAAEDLSRAEYLGKTKAVSGSGMYISPGSDLEFTGGEDYDAYVLLEDGTVQRFLFQWEDANGQTCCAALDQLTTEKPAYYDAD